MGILDFFTKAAKKVVLVVEDDVPLRRFMAERLKENDIDVVETGNGDEVLGLVEKHHPDGIVLDVMLPGKSGMQILEEMRTKGDKTPIVILTTLSGEGGLRLEAVKHKAAFLNKADASPDLVVESIMRQMLL